MNIKSYHVQHILVQHQYEAEDLLKKLQAGSSFEELAKRFSLCPSATVGGDLGLIAIGKADPDFEEEALRMKPKQISSKPLRTRFGYHLIKKIKSIT